MGPVRYFAPMPPGDAGTLGWTVPWMHRLIEEGSRDPSVRSLGREMAATEDPVASAFRFVQSLPYRHDPDDYELLQGAPWLLAQARSGLGYSDCDCRVVLLGSLLEGMGYRTRLVLIRPPGKDAFTHVYQEVWHGGGWVPLDTIFPHFDPGDEVRDATGTKTPIPRLGGDWGVTEKLPYYQPALELAAERFGSVARRAGMPGLEEGLRTVPVVTGALPAIYERAKLGAAFVAAVVILSLWAWRRRR